MSTYPNLAVGSLQVARLGVSCTRRLRKQIGHGVYNEDNEQAHVTRGGEKLTQFDKVLVAEKKQ